MDIYQLKSNLVNDKDSYERESNLVSNKDN